MADNLNFNHLDSNTRMPTIELAHSKLPAQSINIYYKNYSLKITSQQFLIIPKLLIFTAGLSLIVLMKPRILVCFPICTRDHNFFQIYQYSINKAYLFHIHLSFEVRPL